MDKHEVIYIDGDTDTDDSFGKWWADPKYVNEPAQMFIRKDIAQPQPSTDFTEVCNNPWKDYMFFDKTDREWFVGWYAPTSKKFLGASHGSGGFGVIEPSHWLPLPNNP